MYEYSPKIQLCANYIHSGGVIAYPTEAVWGLGCDPFNESAMGSILEIKKRPVEKGVILVADNIEAFDFILFDLPKLQIETLNDTWPGHVTWLIKHEGRVPYWISGQHSTVALRVSTHPVIRTLCQKVGGPIVSTSANPQGLPPATTQFAARHYFKKTDILFCQGVVGANKSPSQIIDLETMQTVRAV